MRAKKLYDIIRFGLEEIKFLKSWKDVKIAYEKVPFLTPRITGDFARDYNVPPIIQLEPTNHCNLRCVSCPRDRMRRDKGFLNYKVFTRIINEAARVGVRRVHLYLHGEPMLHKEIIKMIGDIKSRGMAFNLVTNGMLFDRQKIEGILTAGVNSADYITFSILGTSMEVHEKVMRGVSHASVVANIQTFRDLRSECGVNGPIIEAIFYSMPDNCHEIDEFKRKWKGKVDHVRTVDKISRSFADFNTDGSSSQQLRTRSCKNIWERMTVYWNGDVTICCEDVDGYHILGNVMDKPLTEIWNSGPLSTFKRLHRGNKVRNIRLCSRCDQ